MAQLTARRREAIFKAYQKGTSKAELARAFKVGIATIDRWVKEGHKSSPDWEGAPGRGRPKVTTRAQRADIKQLGRRLHTIPQIISKTRLSHLSKSTIWRVLQGGKHPLKWLKVKRGRQLSPENMAKRLLFAERLDLPSAKHIVFVDSKYIYWYTDGSGNRGWAWQDGDNPPTFPAKSNPPVLHYYSAVAHGHKASIVWVVPTPGVGQGKENFSSKHFIGAMSKLMREVKTWFPAGRDYHVVMDHARQHFSKQSKAAMARLNVPVMESFPAQSWDLNIIENCWGMQANNLQGSRARTVRGYKRAVEKAWEAIETSSINKLVATWEQRLAAVVELEGRWPHTQAPCGGWLRCGGGAADGRQPLP
jgi:transposase